MQKMWEIRAFNENKEGFAHQYAVCVLQRRVSNVDVNRFVMLWYFSILSGLLSFMVRLCEL